MEAGAAGSRPLLLYWAGIRVLEAAGRGNHPPVVQSTEPPNRANTRTLKNTHIHTKTKRNQRRQQLLSPSVGKTSQSVLNRKVRKRFFPGELPKFSQPSLFCCCFFPLLWCWTPVFATVARKLNEERNTGRLPCSEIPSFFISARGSAPSLLFKKSSSSFGFLVPVWTRHFARQPSRSKTTKRAMRERRAASTTDGSG